MNCEEGPGRPRISEDGAGDYPDAPDLATQSVRRLLHAEAARLRPDPTQILGRVRSEILRDDAPARRELFGHRAWAVPLLAAAGVLGVAGAGVAAFGPSGRSPAADRVPAAVTTSTGSAERSPSSAGTRGSVPTAHVGGSSRTSDAPSAGPSRTVRATRPRARPDVQVQTARPGTAVALAGPAAKDWLVAGSVDAAGSADAAAQTVRDTDGQQWLSGPHVSGDPVSSARPGPFSVRWTEGQPTTASSASSSWLVVRSGSDTVPSGLLVSALPGAPGEDLVLFAGVQDTAGDLEVLVAGRTVRRVALAAGRTPTGYVVTVRLRALAAPGQEVSLRLVAGRGGAVAVAAAALR